MFRLKTVWSVLFEEKRESALWPRIKDLDLLFQLLFRNVALGQCDMLRSHRCRGVLEEEHFPESWGVGPPFSSGKSLVELLPTPIW